MEYIKATNEKAKKIASLNDEFRKSFALDLPLQKKPMGIHSISDGFSNLSPTKRIEAAMKIRNFSRFNLMNDFYEEHDTGWFKLENSNIRVHWNIFYFHQIDGSQIEEWGCDFLDAADTNATLRQISVRLDYEV